PTQRQTVTVPMSTPTSSTLRLSVGPESYAVPVGSTLVTSDVADALRDAVNGTSSSHFYAVSSGADLTIYSLADPSFAAALTVDATPRVGTAVTKTTTLSIDNVNNNQDWTLTLSDSGGTLGTPKYTTDQNDRLSDVASHLATAISAVADFYATPSGAVITISR